MAFGEFQGTSTNRAMSEINMVPLIDIVLVLLVLFILAAPMAAQSVKIKLPKTDATQPGQQTDAINIYLQPDGKTLDAHGNDFHVESLDGSVDNLNQENAAPPVRIWSDQAVRYEHLANLIVAVRNKGYSQISLMTQR